MCLCTIRKTYEIVSLHVRKPLGDEFNENNNATSDCDAHEIHTSLEIKDALQICLIRNFSRQ